MRNVDRDLDRILVHLRNQIRDRGFTQMEVQESLRWGRSYISQLLTQQKSLRLEQVLMILDVIGVTPEAFFAEVYPPREPHRPGGRARAAADDGSSLRAELGQLRQLVDGLARVLERKNLITSAEVAAAIQRFRGQGTNVKTPGKTSAPD